MPNIFEATELKGAEQKLRPPVGRIWSTPLLNGEYPPAVEPGQASVQPTCRFAEDKR